MKLLSVKANFDGFHPIHFNRGASFFLANREKEATRKDSRNGLGKSTAISIIDFCLGGQISRELEGTVGRGWTFTLTLETRTGATVEVSRSPDDSGSLLVGGERARAGIRDPKVNDDQPLSVGVHAWTRWLQTQSFPARGIDSAVPTWRSLIRHFIRFHKDAFIDPFRTVKSPGAEQLQIENAYFLGLDWGIPREWASLRADRLKLDALEVEGVSLDDKIASLESRLAKAKSRLSTLDDELGDFSIVPEYRAMERDANHLAAGIKALTNEIMSGQQLMSLYETKLRAETATGEARVTDLYEEAGVVLGDAVIRSLEEASAFYLQVSANRRNYLQDEISRLTTDLEQKEQRRTELGSKQAEVLQVLRSGGALEDFAELQKRFAAAQSEVSACEIELEELGRVGARQAKLKSDETALAVRTRRDLTERFNRRESILDRFAQILESLYGGEANLKVYLGQGRSGLQLKSQLPKGGSDGIDNMAIFAYNIAVSEAFAKEGIGPGFLIHDSPMFADVDERQFAQALEIAISSSEEFGYQYIAALNSDKVPWADLTSQDGIRSNTVLSLSDADPAGSLFGERVVAASDPETEASPS